MRRTISNERKKAILTKIEKCETESGSDKPLNTYLDNIRSISINSTCNSNEGSETSGSVTDLENTQILSTDVKNMKEQINSESLSSKDQLKKIVNNLQKKSTKSDFIDSSLNEIQEDLISEIESCNKNVDQHILDYENSTKETEQILAALNENDEISKKFSQLNISDDHTKILDFTDLFKTKDKNMNHLTKKFESSRSIISNTDSPKNTHRSYINKNNEVYKQSRRGSSSSVESFRSNNNNKSEVEDHEKEKLLAKLRAIDNGENVEVTPIKKSKQDLLKELFG